MSKQLLSTGPSGTAGNFLPAILRTPSVLTLIGLVTHVVVATCTCRRLPGASQAWGPGLARRRLEAGGRRTMVGGAAEGVDRLSL